MAKKITAKNSANSMKSTSPSKETSTEPTAQSRKEMGFCTKAAIIAFLPFLLGLFISSKIFPKDLKIEHDSRKTNTLTKNSSESSSSPQISPATPKRKNNERFEAKKMMQINELGNPFAEVSIVIHQNGNSNSCASLAPSKNILEAIYDSISSDQLNVKPGYSRNKYFTDAILTSAIDSLLERHECAGTNKKISKLMSGEWLGNGASDTNPLLTFCDMGIEHTPIQPDHQRLVPMKVGSQSVYPCHFHTREGLQITSLHDLASLSREKSSSNECSSAGEGDGAHEGTCTQPELHLYAVPAGRVFMFSPSYAGEIFELPHATIDPDKPVSLEVISTSPRVFDIKNFFSLEESNAIVEKALNEKSESHRIKASSTGASGYNLNSKRTSENGFDTHGKEAIKVKKRCFKVLGFDDYHESLADGLQVLRYNKTKAYVPHYDWIEDPHKREEHNFDSEGIGSNRFATILLYFTDLPDDAGGQTVFTKAWPSSVSESDRVPTIKELINIRSEGLVDDFEKGSWEEKMVAECRVRLSVVPKAAKAVLFYSQHPDGRVDDSSLHGGCPVLEGSKWAANLWVWNAIRSGYPGAPENAEVVLKNKGKNVNKSGPQTFVANFRNSGKNPLYDNAELYFQETFWSKYGKNDPPFAVNTFDGHEWNVYVDGKPVKQWIISEKNPPPNGHIYTL